MVHVQEEEIEDRVINFNNFNFKFNFLTFVSNLSVQLQLKVMDQLMAVAAQ
jgi:hypothetical protein